ncbi:hypothetical protein NDN08_004719 [Rhodosorus marinus]|uniref:Steroid 5-alpha reductase C-terminal domain-containing protein n=1 Tax=Rhodosorus marinus TaxID=101924 RepID=A0AAV8UQN2_9RHOD|nr:hypothetical protein NDN08_004719 [Rhodosorus marinus]
MAVQVLDENYLGITALVLFGWNFIFFLIAYAFKFDKVTDFAGGTGFSIAALLTFLLNQTYFPRQIVMTVLVMVWSARLAGFLLWRILKWGEDNRFDDIRSNLAKLISFWTFQFLWNFIVSLTVISVNSVDTNPAIGAADIIGWIMWSIGFFFEAVGDVQKTLFKVKPEGKGTWCNAGLWTYTRHPNYFGEFMMWWGLFVAGAAVYGNTWRWVSILSPVFLMTILLFLSGINLGEESANKKYGSKPEYWKYKKETSNVIPFPNGLFAKIPDVIKKIFFFEFPVYNKMPTSEEGRLLTR